MGKTKTSVTILRAGTPLETLKLTTDSGTTVFSATCLPLGAIQALRRKLQRRLARRAARAKAAGFAP